MATTIGESRVDLENLNKRFQGKLADKMSTSSLLTHFNKLSGPRAHLFYTHVSKCLVLNNAETPLIYTGYELAYGQRSNGYKTAKSDYQIVKKIIRHRSFPNMKYLLVLLDLNTGVYTVEEVCHYKSLTEMHGYVRPETPMDYATEGTIIRKGEDFYRSTSTDKFNNYKYGINVKAAFVNTLNCVADAVFISDEFAEKASFYLIEETEIVLNLNDVLLNLHGNKDFYKSLPYVGEEISDNGILCARRKIDFSLAAANLTDSALSTPLESDDIFRGKGVVVDMDIMVNKQDELLANKDPFRNQIKEIFEDQLRYNREIYDVLHPIVANDDSKYTFELRHTFDVARNYINNTQLNTPTDIQYATNNGKFEYVYLSIKVAHKKKLECADKISQRSAAKGVISAIIPKDQMFRDEYGNVADICFAGKGIIGRLNIAQVYEHELNFISNRIVAKMKDLKTTEERFEFMLDFIKEITEEQYEDLKKFWKTLKKNEKDEFINGILDYGYIHIYQPPFYGNATLAQIDRLYSKYDIKPGYARFKLRFKMNSLLKDKYINKSEFERQKFLHKYMMKPDTFVTIDDRLNKKKLVKSSDGREFIVGKKFTMEDRMSHEKHSIFSKLATGLKVVLDEQKTLTRDQFNSTEAIITIKNDILTRDFRTIRPLIIAPIYVMVLNKIAETGFSARSLGSVNQIGMPVKPSKTNKGYAYNSSPISFSFMDICNSSCRVPMEIVHRFKSVHASNPELREMMAECLLMNDPFKLHNLAVSLENTYNDVPARMWKAYLWGLHIGFLENGEKDPFEKFDAPEFQDLDKIFRTFGTIDVDPSQLR